MPTSFVEGALARLQDIHAISTSSRDSFRAELRRALSAEESNERIVDMLVRHVLRRIDLFQDEQFAQRFLESDYYSYAIQAQRIMGEL